MEATPMPADGSSSPARLRVATPKSDDSGSVKSAASALPMDETTSYAVKARTEGLRDEAFELASSLSLSLTLPLSLSLSLSLSFSFAFPSGDDYASREPSPLLPVLPYLQSHPPLQAQRRIPPGRGC